MVWKRVKWELLCYVLVRVSWQLKSLFLKRAQQQEEERRGSALCHQASASFFQLIWDWFCFSSNIGFIQEWNKWFEFVYNRMNIVYRFETNWMMELIGYWWIFDSIICWDLKKPSKSIIPKTMTIKANSFFTSH